MAQLEVVATRWAVVAVVRSGEAPENLRVLTHRWGGAPDTLALRRSDPLGSITVVDAPEIERVEASGVGQRRGLGRRMAERIDLPAYRRYLGWWWWGGGGSVIGCR